MSSASIESLADALRAELASASAPADGAAAAVRARADEILRPPGALAVLDDIAVFLAGWQATETPDVDNPAVLIFAADHGVAADGVSAYPADVTAAMLDAIREGRATINALADAAGASVTAVDVGVGRPTANLRIAAAMTHNEFDEAFAAGRQAVSDLYVTPEAPDLLVVGEVGIGNTTAAATVTAAILGGPVAPFVGSGTGVDASATGTKVAVVSEAVQRIRTDCPDGSALEILRQGGGRELVAMAGAMTEARLRSLPLLLDGYIASTSALAMHTIDPGWTAHMIAGTRSAEPGHVRILEQLALRPLLDLELRLGEGSGAAAALPLLRSACRAVTRVATFSEWFGAE